MRIETHQSQPNIVIQDASKQTSRATSRLLNSLSESDRTLLSVLFPLVVVSAVL